MVVVAPKDRWLCPELRGKIGRPIELGNMWLGWSELGDQNPMSGVWQRRKTKQGQKIVKMRYSQPPFVNTYIQQVRRAKFSSAITAWNNLDVERQIFWNKKTSPKGMSGYNRFIGWYMKQSDDVAVLGLFQIGFSQIGSDYLPDIPY